MEKIIRVNKRHIDELARIDFESQHPTDARLKLTPDNHKSELLERFAKDNEHMFGYRINNQLAGYVTLKTDFPGYKHAEVYWLAVRDAYQGKGIGTKLLIHVENLAKKLGFRAVFLYTGKPMLLAQEFYTKNGYSFVNEFPNYYSQEYAKASGSASAVLFTKKL